MLYFATLICLEAVLIEAVANGTYFYDGYTYEPWTDIANSSRTYLFCPHSHCDGYLVAKDMEHCCQCSAKPVWELQPDLMGSLHIEYRSRRGAALVVSTKELRDYQYVELVHTNGFISEIPANVCEFAEKLIRIDLSQNGLVNVANLSCLINLDTLILTQNKISCFKNTSFSELSLLRVVDLSKNVIKELEPTSLSGISLFIHIADFSENLMETVDITNIITENPFCVIDYRTNQISEITNTLSFEIDDNKIYGNGGYVNFENNVFQTWINFTELGFPDLTLIGKIFNFGFDLRGANWTCDCKMQPFLELVRPYLSKIWRDYFNITCSNPSELSGLYIEELVRNNQLDDFICNVSTSNGCPKGCSCYEQPSKKRTVVNCTGIGLNAMPSKLPAFDNIELFVEDNSIRELDEMVYLNRIQRLEINDNPLQKITFGVAKKLKHNVALRFNCKELVRIPSTFKQLDQRKINLGKCGITCDCESKWVKDWIVARYDDSSNNLIYCKAFGGNIPVLSFDFDSLDCEGNKFFTYFSIILAMFLILLTVCVLLLYHYRHEITLLRKNPTVGRQSTFAYKYDVYIIINENNDDARLWTRTVLVPKLRRIGYITYFPYTDELSGNAKEELIIQKLSESRDVIAILTSDFLSADEDLNMLYTNLEWRHGWNKFKDHSSEQNLIVINFDHLKAREFSSSPLKAFLRLHMALDFADRNHNLMKDLLSRLGRPSRVNRKPVYTQAHKDKTQFIELEKHMEPNRKVNVEGVNIGLNNRNVHYINKSFRI